MNLLLGIDLGTSYFKVGLFDPCGNLKGLGRSPVRAESPEKSRFELPIDNFWSALEKGFQSALEEAGGIPADIKGVSYSSQANSFLLADADGNPLTSLILWTDTRPENVPDPMRALWGREDFMHATGNGLLPSTSLAAVKISWLRQNKPQLWKKTEYIMTISDYLVYSLTGKRVGDAGTGLLTGMIDPRKNDWWSPALEELDIPRRMLSSPLRPGSFAGETAEDAVNRLALPSGIPVAVGSLDHHVAALGAGVGSLAPISESTGTVLACVGIKNRYDPKEGICTGPGFENDFYQLAFDSNGASVLEWYQQNYVPEISVEELIQLAAEVPPGCDGLKAKKEANSYEGLEGFENKKPSHTHGYYVRALMESINGTLASLIDELYPDGNPERIVATGGGSRSDLWLQMKADLLKMEVMRTTCEEPACQGAGMIAARAAGYFTDFSEVFREWIGVDKKFMPS